MEYVLILIISFGIIFLLDNLAKYVLDCIKRTKSRKTAMKRLEHLKWLEEYENRVTRFIDPNYYGD